MTTYRYLRWEGLDGLVRRAVLAIQNGEEVLGVTQAVWRGRWMQRPVDVIYDGEPVTREVAQAEAPDVDLDGPIAGYERGYLTGDVRRDPVARGVWDIFDMATREERELTLDEAVELADLFASMRRRYEAAWEAALDGEEDEDV